jgi:hypothetical protein
VIVPSGFGGRRREVAHRQGVHEPTALCLVVGDAFYVDRRRRLLVVGLAGRCFYGVVRLRHAKIIVDRPCEISFGIDGARKVDVQVAAFRHAFEEFRSIV